jgi:hypothetical protein
VNGNLAFVQVVPSAHYSSTQCAWHALAMTISCLMAPELAFSWAMVSQQRLFCLQENPKQLCRSKHDGKLPFMEGMLTTTTNASSNTSVRLFTSTRGEQSAKLLPNQYCMDIMLSQPWWHCIQNGTIPGIQVGISPGRPHQPHHLK